MPSAAQEEYTFENRKIHPMQLLQEKRQRNKEEKKKVYLNISAPMVRYSKLAFRETVRQYGVDLCFTPMILSDVFRNSSASRECELLMTERDDPLIVQFAASNGKDAADAAEMVARHVNGVDLNCGCPQKWAYQEKIGSYLSEHPEITADIVNQVKRRTSSVMMTGGLNSSDLPRSFACSIKIRIDEDLRKTVDLCLRAEAMGADFITVHGRLKSQKNEGKANQEAMKLVKERLSIPVFGNGGVESVQEADDMATYANLDGIMAAQGLLANPAMFAGHAETPLDCIKAFVDNSLSLPQSNSNHFIFHHHLMYMLESRLKRKKIERTYFNTLPSIPAVLDYLDEHIFPIRPDTLDPF